jgi:hypothetical protein
MGIHKSRSYHPATGIDNLDVATGKRFNLRARADRCDPAIPDDHRAVSHDTKLTHLWPNPRTSRPS